MPALADFDRSTWKGYGCAGLMTVIFCVHYLVAKLVLEEVEVFALGAARGLLGGLLLLAVFWRDVSQHLKLSILIKAAICGFFTFGINQVLFLYGLRLSTPTNAAVLSNLIPIVTFLLAAAWGLETWLGRRAFGVVFGFLCVAGYFYYLFNVQMVEYLQGNLLIFASVFSLSLGLVLIKKWAQDIPHHVLSAFMLFAGGLFLGLLGWQDLPGAWEYSAQGLFPAILMAFEVIISTAVAYLANVMAFKYLPASTTMSFAYFQPFFTALLVFGVFGTLPHAALIAVFGGALIANFLVRKGSG